MSKYSDLVRGFAAFFTLFLIVGGGFLWVKAGMPNLIVGQKIVTSEQSAESKGTVAGDFDSNKIIDEEKAKLQKQIEQMKKDLLELKPETIKQQEQVKKILKDLETVKEQASQSAQILDLKGNLCEEAKKRFCQ